MYFSENTFIRTHLLKFYLNCPSFLCLIMDLAGLEPATPTLHTTITFVTIQKMNVCSLDCVITITISFRFYLYSLYTFTY